MLLFLFLQTRYLALEKQLMNLTKTKIRNCAGAGIGGREGEGKGEGYSNPTGAALRGRVASQAATCGLSWPGVWRSELSRVSPAEGRRFISDQGRRKELADRPPPGG